jgi:hypothetical protein
MARFLPDLLYFNGFSTSGKKKPGPDQPTPG